MHHARPWYGIGWPRVLAKRYRANQVAAVRALLALLRDCLAQLGNDPWMHG